MKRLTRQVKTDGSAFCRDFQHIQPVAYDEQCVDDKCKCFDSDDLRVCEVRVCDLPTACVDTLCRCNDRMVEEISRYDSSSPKMNPVIFVNHSKVPLATAL